MPPFGQAATPDEGHINTLLSLSIAEVPKPFRNPNWKPPQRRNKNVKQIIADAARREQASASLLATQNNSGYSTPLPNSTPVASSIAQAGERLSNLALGQQQAPSVTYTNIESAPSMHPKKKYCDLTGLPAAYRDPKTGLQYANREVYGIIATMTQSQAEGYLEARKAGTVLK